LATQTTSSELASFEADGVTPLSGISFGKQMIQKKYPAGSYESLFMNQYFPNIPAGTNASYMIGSQICHTVTLENTSLGTLSALTVNLTPNDPSLSLSSPHSAGSNATAASCLNSSSTSVLTSESSCQLAVCFAPNTPGTLNSNQTLHVSWSSSDGSSHTLSPISIQGTGVGPAKVFASGTGTTLIDGLGQSHWAGTGTTGWVSSKSVSGIREISSGGLGGSFGVCRIRNEILECSANESPFTTVPLEQSGTPTQIAVGSDSACTVLTLRGTQSVVCWQSDQATGSANSTPDFYAPAAGTLLGTDTIGIILAGKQYNCSTVQDSFGVMRLRCWGPGTSNPFASSTLGSLTGASALDQNTCALLRPQNTVSCSSGGPLFDEIILSDYDQQQATLVSMGIGSSFGCIQYPTITPATPTTVSCWGSQSNAAVPSIVFGSSVMLTAGSSHACSVTSDNKVYCWGDPAAFGNITSTPAGPKNSVYLVFDAMK
jgi:hypothetical protein